MQNGNAQSKPKSGLRDMADNPFKPNGLFVYKNVMNCQNRYLVWNNACQQRFVLQTRRGSPCRV